MTAGADHGRVTLQFLEKSRRTGVLLVKPGRHRRPGRLRHSSRSNTESQRSASSRSNPDELVHDAGSGWLEGTGNLMVGELGEV